MTRCAVLAFLASSILSSTLALSQERDASGVEFSVSQQRELSDGSIDVFYRLTNNSKLAFALCKQPGVWCHLLAWTGADGNFHATIVDMPTPRLCDEGDVMSLPAGESLSGTVLFVPPEGIQGTARVTCEFQAFDLDPRYLGDHWSGSVLADFELSAKP